MQRGPENARSDLYALHRQKSGHDERRRKRRPYGVLRGRSSRERAGAKNDHGSVGGGADGRIGRLL